MKVLHWVAKILVVIGALNWGLVGFFNYNLVAEFLGGPMATLTRTVFAVIGIAGLYCLLYHCKKRCCGCGGSCGAGGCGCGSCKSHRGQ